MAIPRECPICLDTFRHPVVTPCGHLSCDACMKTHIRASQDPYEAKCPTCRSPFPTVRPDMSIVPMKYHIFMSPSLRRVYLGDEGDNRARIEILNAEIATLKARVGTLHRDNTLLMGRCESAHSTISRLTLDERDARLALNKAKEDVRLAHQSLENLRRKYQALKSKSTNTAKRKSDHATLDTSVSTSSSESLNPDSSPATGNPLYKDRPIKPMPKRMKRQSTSEKDARDAHKIADDVSLQAATQAGWRARLESSQATYLARHRSLLAGWLAAAAPATVAAAIDPSSSPTPRPRPPPDSTPGSAITGRNRRVAREVSPQLSSGEEFGGDSERSDSDDSDTSPRFGSSSSPFTFQCLSGGSRLLATSAR